MLGCVHKTEASRKSKDGKKLKRKKKSVILKIARKKIKKPVKKGDGPGPDGEGEYEVRILIRY